MTKFTILSDDPNVHPSETDCSVEIAQAAEGVSPCHILMSGDGIPSSRHDDGVLITVRKGEPWDCIWSRVRKVEHWYTVEAPALREKRT